MAAPGTPSAGLTIGQLQDLLRRQEADRETAAQEHRARNEELAYERSEVRTAHEIYLMCRGRYHRGSRRIVEYEDRVKALQDEIREEQEAVREDHGEYQEFHHLMRASEFVQERLGSQKDLSEARIEWEAYAARNTEERIQYLQDEQEAAGRDIMKGLQEFLEQEARDAGTGAEEQAQTERNEEAEASEEGVVLRGRAAAQGCMGFMPGYILSPTTQDSVPRGSPAAPTQDIRMRAYSPPAGCLRRTVGLHFMQAVQSRTFVVTGQATSPATGLALPTGKAPPPPPPAGGWGTGMVHATSVTTWAYAQDVHRTAAAGTLSLIHI